MTKAELIAALAPFPDDMPVRYEYDGGYDYYSVEKVCLHTEETRPEYGTFICLDLSDQ
jgi:hypothetical protein